ncbi:MAG TPA: GNAT family N-acetyltransferase [Solirubrobacteraceae bacterium]|nr:GNAT family N-acetyltransferase [Solirubrobacteraceae bacterium]
MRIRPLQPEDARPALEAARAALPAPPELDPAQAAIFWSERFGRLLTADPGGCWAAEDETGRVVGCALALVRDGLWGLSFLAVHPDFQARGVGRRLVDAALTHADGTRGGIIASSVDPKAMRRYARAGFDLRPCVAAAGIVDRSAIPTGLRSMPTDDVSLCEPLGRAIRGGAYAPEDLGVYLAAGWRALRCGDDGLALECKGSPALVLGRTEEAAADLLWSCLAASPNGGTVHCDFIMARQDWAVRALLDAGLALSPDGPMFTRGELGPLRPWIPAGTFL